MKPFYAFITAIFLIMSTLGSQALSADSEQTTQTRTSTNGMYKVTIDSWLKPLKLGRMHAWTASIRDSDDKPVTNAKIKISGGMPIHNHGFPTQPIMTKQVEDGVYLLEGFKFSMGGPWLIVLDITVDKESDSVAFDIDM